jgi:electron transfer flavoprotein alpha subunit
LISSSGYKNVVGATTSLGKDIIPRVAGYFSSQPITDIIEISVVHSLERHPTLILDQPMQVMP